MNYQQMGIAAMIPGMQHMIDLMQRELDSMRAQLAQAQNSGSARGFMEERKRGPGRPKLIEGNFEADDAAKEFQRKSRASSSFWARMSPEERSAEMRRRGARRKDRRQGRGGDHYGKVSAGAKGYWAKMTKEERRAEVQRRAEVRNKKWAEDANVEKLHPRDPRSPKHEAWLKKMSRVMKASYKARASAVPAVKMAHVNGEAVQ